MLWVEMWLSVVNSSDDFVWFLVAVTPLSKSDARDLEDEARLGKSDFAQMRSSSRAAKKQWDESTVERRKLGLKKGVITVSILLI